MSGASFGKRQSYAAASACSQRKRISEAALVVKTVLFTAPALWYTGHGREYCGL